MKNTKYPIYIPSKGRANKCLTANLLLKDEVEFKIVVEPQDEKSYSEKYGQNKIIVLDRNNGGLSYARNYIKKLCFNKGESHVWQLDDDINYFLERINNKNVRQNALKVLSIAETEIDKYSNVGISGLVDCLYAWTKTTDLGINKLVASAVLIKTDLPVLYSSEVIEDLDYAIQVLQSGQCTILFHRIMYQKQPNNVANGGQNNEKLIGYTKLQENVVAKYPEHYKMRYDAKKNLWKLAPSRIWLTFKQSLIIK